MIVKNFTHVSYLDLKLKIKSKLSLKIDFVFLIYDLFGNQFNIWIPINIFEF